jgi:serine/threonine protein kinase
MSQLEPLLDAFHRGEAGFEELEAAVAARLRASPRSGHELTTLLDTARDQGLPREVHQALVAKIDQHAATTSSGTTWGAATAGAGYRDDDRAMETGFMLHGRHPAEEEEAAVESEARAALTTTGGFSAPAEGESPELGEGDHLRGRFELIAKLGEGGMGAVWKGKDLLKEEAKDRNPYVAIKLLQKNFKEHPDAFVALQRETAKQQRLAHPNVATVFNFDRDTDSGAVFMSMDLLEGESLDAFIRNMPEGGHSESEAMSIIEQLAAGLAYAHRAGLVHSDLKPGNCFLTRDGTVKLLDFGIARASKTKADAEGVTTLFDPGELGAITPAYATVEMFEGQEPDPRDDIYALGIMAYQLLTGRHPYDKMSAPRALEQGLVPEPVAKLSKRQNRGLARALALNRDERTASVDQFIDDIKRKHNLRVYGIAASVLAAVLIAVLAYAQIKDFVRSEENEAIFSVLERGGVENLDEGLSMIQALESEEQRRDVLKDSRTRRAVLEHIEKADRHSIREALALIRPFDPAWQQDIRDDARDVIIEHYEDRIYAAFNPDDGTYDYAEANTLLETLGTLYPNSARVVEAGNELARRHEKELGRLTEAYDNLLDDLQLPPGDTEQSIGDVLNAIRLLDPEHPTLKDPRLADTLIDQTHAAIDAGDLTRAKIIMDLAGEFISDDPTIAQLREQLAARLEHQRQDNLALELRTRLEQERGSLNTLADFRLMQNDLMMLASLRPRDSMLSDLRWQLKQIFISEFDALTGKQSWQQAESLLVDFARFFEIPYVASQRGRLSILQKAHDYRMPASASRRNELARRANVINESLRQPLLTPEWEAKFETAFKESLAMIGDEGSGVTLIRRTMMLLYRDRAVEAVRAKQYVRARNLISKGRAYVASAPELDEVDKMLVEAQQTVLRKKEFERRDSRVSDAGSALLAHAAAGRPEEAARALQTLRADLPANDPFISESAEPAVIGAYLESAAKHRAAGDLDAAVRQLERAQAVSPTPEIRKTLAQYRDERAHTALTASLSQALGSEAALDVDALVAGITEHARQYPDEHEALMAELVALAAVRLASQTGGPPLDGSKLHGELDALRSLFPQSANSLENEVA